MTRPHIPGYPSFEAAQRAMRTDLHNMMYAFVRLAAGYDREREIRRFRDAAMGFDWLGTSEFFPHKAGWRGVFDDYLQFKGPAAQASRPKDAE
jgi:hypothetical protein